MRKKGFTLVELLVVIAIIALLMGILMPALARVRQLAFRMVCGTNLSGIGKAMLLYSQDYDDEIPRAGGRNSDWYQQVSYAAANRFTAYGMNNDGSGGGATISSCFYLLVKYAEVTPKSFVCKGDTGADEYKLSDDTTLSTDIELTDLWDFGPYVSETDNPSAHCSYTMQMPFTVYALTTSGEPGAAIAGDRNPWLISPGTTEIRDFSLYAPAIAPWNRTSDEAKNGNTPVHQDDGQNVLFLDGHVNFEKFPYCGIEDDNVYTLASDSPEGVSAMGSIPIEGTFNPASRKDSVMVHDTPNLAAGGGRRR
jgi:prepilin-type N-terminal cleavage/methylation domain-containing protein/prepilin-type processing-associated H-X9-DG protein